jgi:hypothetical protein
MWSLQGTLRGVTSQRIGTMVPTLAKIIADKPWLMAAITVALLGSFSVCYTYLSRVVELSSCRFWLILIHRSGAWDENGGCWPCSVHEESANSGKAYA